MARTFNETFKRFATSLQQIIAGYGSTDEDLTTRQKRQVETLVKLEKQFKKILQEDSRGHLVYKAFIKFILEDKKNILAARPYFRERQGSFAKGISKSIKEKNFKRLYKYNINYPFIVFALNCINWGKNSKITKAANEVYKARKEIVVMNMPLAIAQARIFKHGTPESHLSYMDLIQISFEGLINAVDKFVLPYTPVFRSVIIGRVKGDLIENYSDTLLHFFPSDKRKIYRANKAQRGQVREDVNYENLAENVNETGPKLPTPTTPSEIQHLISASSGICSLDSPPPESDNFQNEGEVLSDRYAANEDIQPDVRIERNELFDKLYNSMSVLNVLEIKYLKMKGIPIYVEEL